MSLEFRRSSTRPQRQREKVYGRRRNGPLEDRDGNLQLFAGIEAADIEKAIAKLSISEPKGHNASACQVKVVQQTSASRHGSSSSPRLHEPANDAPPARRQASSRRRPRIQRATLTKGEAISLEPVLAFPRIDSAVYDFESFGAHLTEKFDISKLSEGSYSDCFIFKRHKKYCEQAVLKIIPFDCAPKPSAGIATHSQGFLREVKVLAALEPYHGFAQIHASHIVKGRMNQKLSEAARSWLETTADDIGKSIDPATRYADDQMFGIIEMAFAGRDLELLSQPSAFQAFDAFWKTAILIAKAEMDIEFEHRDLHMSNICFKSGAAGRENVTLDFVKSLKDAPSAVLGLSGLDINIIDYTHSRMKDSETGDILYSPDAPFTALELQEYGIGRQPCDQMDTVIKAERWMSRQADLGTDGTPKYAGFTPKTNVIWLSHILTELTKHSLINKKWSYMKGSSAKARTLQTNIWKRLRDVLDMISSNDLASLPAGAEDLVQLAVEKGLVSREDVDKFKAGLNGQSPVS